MAKIARRDLDSKGYTISVKSAAGASPAAEQQAGGEFARFENLTAKLVKVPKSELDEKRR